MLQIVSGLRCARCGAQWESVAFQPNESGLKAGMALVCGECLHLQVVAEDGRLRHMFDYEFQAVIVHPKALHAAQVENREFHGFDDRRGVEPNHSIKVAL